jgi:hypothetical protein
MEKWELLNLFQEWDWGIKENNRGCEFNSDILYELLYMSHYDPSTTIKNMLWLPWQYLHLCWHVLFASQQLSLWQHRKFFWVALGFELRAYMLATLSAFCLVIFFFIWDSVLQSICGSWFWNEIFLFPASWAVSITGTSHLCLTFIEIFDSS